MTPTAHENILRSFELIVKKQPETWLDAVSVIESEIGKDAFTEISNLTLFEILSSVTVADLTAMSKRISL